MQRITDYIGWLFSIPIVIGAITVFFFICSGYGIIRFGEMEKKINGLWKGSLSTRIITMEYAVFMGMGFLGQYLCLQAILNLQCF